MGGFDNEGVRKRVLETAPTELLAHADAVPEKTVIAPERADVGETALPLHRWEGFLETDELVQQKGKSEQISAPEAGHSVDDSDLEESGPQTENGMPAIGLVLERRYRLVRKLGTGGTAEVFLAEHIALGNLWAIKVLSLTDGTLSDHLNEAEMLKRLNHPMLPRIADILKTRTHVYIVMDYLSGGNLLDRLEQNGPVPETDVRNWMMQVCDVLSYLHALKPEPVIYRDLKPSNLIIDEQGNLKLVDFGTARTYRSGRDGDTVYIGTQGYAAPEQFGVNQSDGRTDLYNLGMAMLHLLTGVHPVTLPHGERAACMKTHAVSVGMTGIIVRCTALLPAKRFQDAKSLKTALLEMDRTRDESNSMREKMKQAPLPVVQSLSDTDEAAVSEVAGVVESPRNKDLKKSGERRQDPFRLRIGKAGRPALPTRMRIAIMGVCPGAGATFASISLATWFSGRGCSTAYLELNPSGDLTCLQRMLEKTGQVADQKNATQRSSSFQFQNVSYHMACTQFMSPDQQAEVCIGDMGSLHGGRFMEEGRRADWLLAYCPMADWKMEHVAEFMELHDRETKGVFHYLMPGLQGERQNWLGDVLGTQRLVPFPTIRNPFQLSPAEERGIERMLKAIGAAGRV